MKRVLVDTNAWHACFHLRDPDHAAIEQAIKRWAGRLVTHNFIFDEAVTLARSRAGHAAARELGEYLRAPEIVDLVRVTADDEEAAWERFCRDDDKGYSFTDCVSFAVMRRIGIDRAITLDRHFRQAGFETEPEAPSGWRVSEEARPFGAATGRPFSRESARRRPRAAFPSSRKKAPRSGRARS